MIARDADALATTCREIEALGGEAASFVADVADAGAVETAAASLEERLGPIDVWVNNAMATVVSPVADLAPDVVPPDWNERGEGRVELVGHLDDE